MNLEMYRSKSRGVLQALRLYNTEISAGDGRVVFDLTADTVIKVAINKGRWSIKQNELEIARSPKLNPEFITRVLDSSDDGKWLVMEKAYLSDQMSITKEIRSHFGGKTKGHLLAMYMINQNPIEELYDPKLWESYTTRCRRSSWFRGFCDTFYEAGYRYPDLNEENFMFNQNNQLVVVDYGIDYPLRDVKRCCWF